LFVFRHWQLRNLISSDQPNVINYVSVTRIYQLDLNTNKLSLVVNLTFPPRCSASGFGYICAAGEENGLIAIINVNAEASEASEVDEQVPIPGINHGEHGSRRSDRPKRQPIVKLDQIGTSIINSIAIYKIEGNPKAGIRDDVVAVLTNNDFTVRILSLSEGIETAVLDLTFPVNHATISPDGQTLVAVGDHQQAYFFEKIVLNPTESKISTAKYASSHCRWVLLNIARLHFPLGAGISGYFSTAWSSSGALCAVASENGYITVLDAERIKAEECGEDTIVTIVSSTRPHAEPGPGSVRTLHFSPQPWDLLIWSEGRGRICVADMRYALNSRQVLHLKPEPDSDLTSLIEVGSGTDIESAALRDTSRSYVSPRYSQIMQQLRTIRDTIVVESPAVAEDDSPRSGSRRRVVRLLRNEDLRNEESSSPESLPALESNMEEDERIILEVLTAGHTTDPLPSVPSPRSIRYRRSELSGLRGNTDIISRAAERQEFMSDAMSVLRRHRGEIDRYNSHPLPRRQASIIVSSEEAQQSPLPPRSWAELSTDLFPSTESRARLRTHLINDPQTYVDLAGESSQPARNRLAEDSDAINHDRRLRRAQEREQRLREVYKLTQHDLQLLKWTSSRNKEDGPESAGLLTAGIVVSPDGKSIWAGCQNGIYEYKLNMRNLMNFPSLEAR
jgi:WD40 repeat protein